MFPNIAGMASSRFRDKKLAQVIKEADTAVNLKSAIEEDVCLPKADGSPSKFSQAGMLDRHRYLERIKRAEKLEKLQAFHDEAKQLYNHLEDARYFRQSPENMELGHQLAKVRMESDVPMWSNGLGHVPKLEWRLAFAKNKLDAVKESL